MISRCSFTVVAAFLAVALAQPPAEPGPDGKAPQTTKPVVTFGGHAAEVKALRFSADGKRVTSVSIRDVRAWRSDSGNEIRRFDHGGGLVFALGPDGTDGPTLARVAHRSNVETRLDDLQVVVLSAAADGTNPLTIDPHGKFDRNFPFRPKVNAIAFSPDGQHVVTAGSVAVVGGPHGLPGGAVKIWDAQTGKELRRLGQRTKWDQHFQQPLPSGEVLPNVSTSSSAGSVTYSADGTYIIAGTYGAGSELPEAGEVWIWSAADGKLIRMFTVADKVKASGPDYPVTAVALSPDNKRAAAAVAVVSARRDGPPTEVRIWEVASGRAVHTLRGHTSWVAQLAFSPNGKWLASAGSDRVVRLWDTARGKEVIAFPFDTPKISALAFSPDGRRLAAGGGDGTKAGEVRVWACPTN